VTTYLFLERRFEPALMPADVMAMAVNAAGCFGLHRVNWHYSLLSTDGHRMVCSFSAPDAESARIAMRQSSIDSTNLWRGHICDAPHVNAQDVLQANVLVERSFEQRVSLQEIQDIEDAGLGCLQSRRVRFIRTFFAADQKRMLCLYAAPDTESVREAQRQAGVPFADAWPFRLLGPTEPVNVSY